MKRMVAKLDPRWEKYRTPKAEHKYIPGSKTELIEVLARTPKNILPDSERTIISTAMSFGEKPVSSIMLPKSKMTFVHENDFLGPLMLDALYKAGFEHFPVIGASGRITGLLHTRDLNALKIQETDRAIKYLDENVYYIRDDHTLEMAMAAFLRTNSYFFIVINRSEKIVGLITYEMVAENLLGRKIRDNFDKDLSIYDVARREKTP